MPLRFNARKREAAEPGREIDEMNEDIKEAEQDIDQGAIDFSAILTKLDEKYSELLTKVNDMAESLTVLATEGVYINDVVEDVTKKEDINQKKAETELLEDLDFSL